MNDEHRRELERMKKQETLEDKPDNPLARFSTTELKAELRRRKRHQQYGY